MKVLSILSLIAIFVTVTAVSEENRISGENGWYIPQIDGSLKWMNSTEAEQYMEKQEESDQRGLTTNPVRFFLFTRSNPNKPQEITANRPAIDSSNFNPKNPIKITIHGWNSNMKDFVNTGIRNAALLQGDYNIIVVEWKRAHSADYTTSVLAVPGVGHKIAKLIKFLVKNYGIKLKTVDLIGHSLGAHVAGFVGKNIEYGLVNAIYGLDPALPLYSFNKPKKRLSSSDAFYVETIHTNGGKLGFLKPIGKAAFYPNGGKRQPGCGADLIGACSHSRATEYFVESIENNSFASVKCLNYQDAVNKNCGNTYSNIGMGSKARINSKTSGHFYVPVNNKSPYGTSMKF